MITDVNQTIRDLMRHEGGIDTADIDVSFETPNREWSSRISKPTLNCYLFDIRERPDRREHGWSKERQQGSMARRQPPLRYALTYLLTAWTRDVEDEHRLLWHTLETLNRFVVLPAEHLHGTLEDVAANNGPIYVELARPESVLKSPGEFWTALENQLKPSLSYTVTVPLDREALIAGPPVRSFELRLQGPNQPPETIDWIGGVVRDAQGAPVTQASIHVAGQHIHGRTDSEGRYRLRGLPSGTYTLLINTPASVTRQEITIPGQDYTITLA